MQKSSPWLRVLCVLTPLVLAITGFTSRLLRDWWLENLAVAFALLAVGLLHRRMQLSNASYGMLFAFLCLHEYGALYSYSNVPIGNDAIVWFGADRNHYDRVIHFLFGLMLTYPGYEAYGAAGLAGWQRLVLPVQSILAASAVYEMLEWVVASFTDPELGIEFVGAQGDIWDGPKDMALALAGSLICMVAIRAFRRS